MTNNKFEYIPTDRIHPFEGHPYRVNDDDEMTALSQSIKQQGVLLPLIVRPLEDKPGEYEAVSGHRRLFASQKAGLDTVPAFVYDITRDEAAVILVDSNLHRENILPSEKAFAYRLKLEAIKHQGKRLDSALRQDGTMMRSSDMVSDEDSGRQVQRYIRLTYLVPELLEMVDSGKVAMTPAVHLSYLTDEEQRWLLCEMGRYDCTPSITQANILKERSINETLSRDFIAGLMSQEKPNQRESIRVPMDRLRGKVPETLSAQESIDFIVKACDFYRNHIKKLRNNSL